MSKPPLGATEDPPLDIPLFPKDLKIEKNQLFLSCPRCKIRSSFDFSCERGEKGGFSASFLAVAPMGGFDGSAPRLCDVCYLPQLLDSWQQTLRLRLTRNLHEGPSSQGLQKIENGKVQTNIRVKNCCDSNRSRSLVVISSSKTQKLVLTCVRCAAIRIARLAFIRFTFAPRGIAEWLVGVDRVR